MSWILLLSAVVLLLLPVRARLRAALPLQAVLLAPLRILSSARSNAASLQLESARVSRLAVELSLENARLRTIVGSMDPNPLQGSNLLRAPVVSRDLATMQRYLVVSRGSRDGVRIGTPAMAPDGVVGCAIGVGPRQAVVRTLLAPDSRVAVANQRNRIPALAIAHVPDLIRLDYTPKDSDYRVGDTLVTAGLGGVYPRGLPVAVVTVSEEEPGKLFRSILARPLANIPVLDHVHLLLVPHEEPERTDRWLENLRVPGLPPEYDNP